MLVVRNVHLVKNQTQILSGISFQVEPNQVTAVVGPSGSGKTSLLRCIAGLENYQGNIELDDQSLNQLPPEKREIGFVEQEATLFPHLTAYNNIAYPLKLRKKNKEDTMRAVDTLLTQLHIDHVRQRYPHQLSGGEQHRVMLARTLIYEPKIILFDEPFAGVDTLLRIELVTLLKTILLHRLVPTLYVTHDLAEANYISQSSIVLQHGQVVANDDPWVQTFLQQRF